MATVIGAKNNADDSFCVDLQPAYRSSQVGTLSALGGSVREANKDVDTRAACSATLDIDGTTG